MVSYAYLYFKPIPVEGDKSHLDYLSYISIYTNCTLGIYEEKSKVVFIRYTVIYAN
jgi:hypothetical protein